MDAVSAFAGPAPQGDLLIRHECRRPESVPNYARPDALLVTLGRITDA